MKTRGMDATMARPKGRRSERDDIAVKIDRAIYEKAKLVSFRRHVPLAELLSDILRAPVEKAYAQEIRKLTQPEDPQP